MMFLRHIHAPPPMDHYKTTLLFRPPQQCSQAPSPPQKDSISGVLMQTYIVVSRAFKAAKITSSLAVFVLKQDPGLSCNAPERNEAVHQSSDVGRWVHGKKCVVGVPRTCR